MKYKKIGVMCGSSDACDKRFLDMAYDLGQELGRNNQQIVYGGGAKGLMTKVADGCLSVGGKVDGYMPEFMIKVEWQHKNLTNLNITKTMAERKYLMMHDSDATIFLPGGCGTMEEFFEWLSAKRLGQYLGPLVIFNFEGYYDPLIELLKRMEREKFHNSHHAFMYSICTDITKINEVLDTAKIWRADAIKTAAAKYN